MEDASVGGEPAHHEATQDDDRGDEGGDGAQELADQGPQAEGVALIPAHDGEVKDHHHEQYAHQQAGHHAAHEQLVHTDAGYTSVDDQGDGGREDGSDDGGGRGDGAGEVLVIAVLFMASISMAPKPPASATAGAGHAGENDAGHHVGMAQAAGDPAHQLFGRIKDLLRDLACIHQVARQNEQGHCDQQERVDAADHLLADDHQGIPQRQAPPSTAEAPMEMLIGTPMTRRSTNAIRKITISVSLPYTCARLPRAFSATCSAICRRDSSAI